MELLVLVPLSFLSSMLAAVVGFGGGLLLISVMPGLLPVSAVVPVHGVVQLASNGSRALFGWREVEATVLVPLGLGGLAGAALGSTIVVRVPGDVLPVLLGAFILVVTWAPRWNVGIERHGVFFVLGALQTFLSLFVGATGPLSSPFLLRADLSRDRLVVTQATWMTIQHSLKIAVFGMVGFAFAPWAPLIACMVLAVTLGSWIGTRLRRRIPEHRFHAAFRVLLTLLALRLLFRLAL